MMFKVLPLIKSGIKSGLVGVMLCGMLTTVTHATSTKLKYDENGRLQAVSQEKSKINNSNALCEGMYATIWARKPKSHLPPNITIDLLLQQGEDKAMKSHPLINLNHAEGKLTPNHDLSRMEVGCLTNNGGLGINIPHSLSEKLSLKVQLDQKGRIFYGYDQIGLELMEPHCPTSERMEKFKKFCEGLGLPIKN